MAKQTNQDNANMTAELNSVADALHENLRARFGQHPSGEDRVAYITILAPTKKSPDVKLTDPMVIWSNMDSGEAVRMLHVVTEHIKTNEPNKNPFWRQ